MTARWWAPQRATLEPDEVVKVLLTPGGDAAGDLGSTLLAAHRAGAAACEVVAKGAVPSEVGLVQAIATVRERLAGPVVDIVAKSLEPTYAGLLVRDVLDEAELGALTLYRAAVSKGVAPPIAAQRVGAVYGVPYKEMGKYAALAVDPRTNPVSLTDAADRTLLGYVSKVVAAEIETTPVAKAETDWESSDHPRDPDTGQFVPKPGQLGSGGVRERTHRGLPVKEYEGEQPAPTTPVVRRRRPSVLAQMREELGLPGPSVAGEKPAPEPQAPEQDDTAERAQARRKVLAEQRRARRIRRQRRQSRQARQAAAARTAAAEPKVEARDRIDTKISAKVGTKISARLRAEFNRNKPNPLPEPEAESLPLGFVPGIRKLPDTMPEGMYERIFSPLVVVMDEKQASAFRKDYMGGFGDDAHPSVVRIGHLIEATGEPAQVGSDIARDNYHAKVDQVDENKVRMIGGREVNIFPTPRVERVEPQRNEDELRAEINRVTRWMNEDENGNLDAGGVARTILTQDYDTGNDILVKVNPIPGTEHTKAPDHVIPTVAEIEIHQARGVENKGTDQDKHVEYVLDPNQAYKMSQAVEGFYDQQRQVFVNRYRLIPITEYELAMILSEQGLDPEDQDRDFGKALQGGDKTRFEQEHPRDAHGRWVDTVERTSTPAPTAVPAPTRKPSVLAQMREELGIPEQQPEEAEQQESTVAPTAAPDAAEQRRARRLRRQRRQARQGRQAAAASDLDAQPKAHARVDSKIDSKISAKIDSKVTRAFEAEVKRNIHGKTMMLDTARTYTVMDQSEWDQLITKVQPYAITNKGEIILHATSPREFLRSRYELDGLQASRAINENVQAQVNAVEGSPFGSFEIGAHRRRLGAGYARSEAERSELAKQLWWLFDEHPEIVQILISHDFSTGRYELFGNRRSISPQYLIEYSEDLDRDKPMVLVPLGEYRTLNMSVKSKDHPHGSETLGTMDVVYPNNAPVKAYHLRNAPVHRYRVDNA